MLQTYSNLIAKKTPFANLPTFTFLVILLAILALPTFAQEPVVGPLLQTKWSQDSPYNDLFPSPYENYNGIWTTDDRNLLVTDCGTTAMAQIVAFHQHPVRAVGQSTIIVPPGGITVPLVNFENYPFDWDNMRNTYTSTDPGTAQERKAVAELMFIFGMARGNGISFPRIFVENFGYDRSIQYHERRFYTDTEWEALIRQQLDLGLPIYYWGNFPGQDSRYIPGQDSKYSGHASVVDGYNNVGKFHFNWGWAGASDGWYSLNNLDPAATSDVYNVNAEHILTNIKPNAGGVPANYELALATFTTNKTAVLQNEQFTVSFRLYSSGFFLGGSARAVLVDNVGEIVTIIGERTIGNNLQPGSANNYEINGSVPATVEPGEYKLRIAVKTAADSDWKLINLSAIRDGVSNSIDFGVITLGATGTVTFAPADGNGTVTASVDGEDIASGDLVKHGKKVIFRATPNDSYRIAGWTVNGVAVLGNETETLEIAHFRSETIVKAIFIKKDFYYYVSAYANATEDMVINVDGDLRLDSRVLIPVPAKAGITLTIKSANSSVPATLLRGIDGNFSVSNGATLILKDIIIDGDAKGDFANSSWALASVSGKLIMENGAVLRNNVNSGSGGGVNVYKDGILIMNGGEISGNKSDTYAGGVYVNGGTLTMNGGTISGNTANSGSGVFVYNGTLTMNGGEISGNSAVTNAGGVYVYNSTFAMSSGKINGNTADYYNGGVFVYNGDFTMTGGEVIGNEATTSATGKGLYIYGESTANLKGGVVTGTGTTINNVVYGTYVNNGNAAIIAWNKPAGNPNYTAGSSTNLTASSGTTATWANKNGKLGIQYANGNNTGFIEITTEGEFVAPIKIPQIAKTTIKAHYANKTIMLENVPANAKVEVYNMQGKRIYSANPENPKILKIGVQTGVYIVRVNNQTLRVTVK